MSKTMGINERIRLLRKEEAEICDNRCPHPDCKKGVCEFYKIEMQKLREKYGKKRA